MIAVIEILLVISAFAKSFWLGVFVLGYISYIEDKYSKTKKQLGIYLTKNKHLKSKYNKIKCQMDIYFIGKKDNEPENNKPMPDWNSMANQIYPYKRCTIVRYDRRFVIIMPDGKRLNKVFDTLERAKEVIDERR